MRCGNRTMRMLTSRAVCKKYTYHRACLLRMVNCFICLLGFVLQFLGLAIVTSPPKPRTMK